MENINTRLLTIGEIEKLGFKRETKVTWIKGRERYFYCNNCGCLSYVFNVKKVANRMEFQCKWCNHGLVLDFK